MRGCNCQIRHGARTDVFAGTSLGLAANDRSDRHDRTYSQKTSLSEAISKTLDGAHPCKLCIVVEQRRAAEQKSEQQKHTLKTRTTLIRDAIDSDQITRSWMDTANY